MANTAQIACSGCRATLAYPQGANCVRCPLCHVNTFVNRVQIRCVQCHITLSLPTTPQLAQCPRCRTVMSMPRLPGQPPRGGAQQQAPNQPPPPPKVVVVIEQPTTAGADGKRVANTSVGTRIDDGNF